jgi:hypothetical protein
MYGYVVASLGMDSMKMEFKAVFLLLRIFLKEIDHGQLIKAGIGLQINSEFIYTYHEL